MVTQRVADGAGLGPVTERGSGGVGVKVVDIGWGQTGQLDSAGDRVAGPLPESVSTAFLRWSYVGATEVELTKHAVPYECGVSRYRRAGARHQSDRCRDLAELDPVKPEL